MSLYKWFGMIYRFFRLVFSCWARILASEEALVSRSGFHWCIFISIFWFLDLFFRLGRLSGNDRLLSCYDWSLSIFDIPFRFLKWILFFCLFLFLWNICVVSKRFSCSFVISSLLILFPRPSSDASFRKIDPGLSGLSLFC